MPCSRSPHGPNRQTTTDEKEWTRHADVFRKAQNALLAFKPSGRGELGEECILWKQPRGAPYVATPVLTRDIIWMVKDGGIVTRVDAGSGRVLGDERLPAAGSYYASPMAADGKVYFASQTGTVSVVADQSEWRLISSRDFHEKIFATPVLDAGRVLIRTDQALYCFGTEEK
jgi:outer membrane protein assembly factor BamB